MNQIVLCKDCWKRGTTYSCPMRHLVATIEGCGYYQDFATDESFCSYGERKDEKPVEGKK